MSHKNYLTGNEYNGENIIALTIKSITDGFTATEWVTYIQAQEMGGSVIKGSKGVKISKVIEDKDTKEIKVRSFTVFNIEQCENLDADLKLTPAQYEIYQTLKKENSKLNRKQLAKISEMVWYNKI